MRISRAIWVIVALVVLVLLLPMPVAERYTSPTQDGQYITNPLRAYRFVVAAIRVSPNSELNTSGKALNRAKELFTGQVTPSMVELLFLPGGDTYSYTTASGETLSFEEPETLVWEVWGTSEGGAGKDSSSTPDVIGFLSYESGELLSSVSG
jgi:hypothetical protein